MELVWSNPNNPLPAKKLHKCYVCGKQDHWNDDWSCVEIAHGKGYEGWEENRNFCSDKCFNKYENEL